MPASREWEQLRADQQKLSELLHRIAADTAAANELAASVQRRLAAQLEQQRAAQRRAEEEWCDAFVAELDGMVASAGFLLQLLFEPDGRRASVSLPIDGTVAQLQAAVHSEGGPVPPLQVLAVGGERLMHLGGTLLRDTSLIRAGVCVTVRRRDPRRRCVDVGEGCTAAVLESGDAWCCPLPGRLPGSVADYAEDVFLTSGDRIESVHLSGVVIVIADKRLAVGDRLLGGGPAKEKVMRTLGQREVVCCSAGRTAVAAVDSDGQLHCCSSFGDFEIPSALCGRVAAVSVGVELLAVLTRDGEMAVVYSSARRGVRTNADGSKYSVVKFGRSAVAVSAGHRHCAALLDDGSVRCFGHGSRDECRVPKGLRDVVSVECGKNWTVALQADGRLSWWGGRLKFGTRVYEPLFPAGFSAGRCVAVAVGGDGIVTVSADGRLTCCWYGEVQGRELPAGRVAVP